MSKRRVARWISRVLDPLVVVPITAVLVFFWAVVNQLPWQPLMIIFLADTVPVVMVMIGVVQRRGWQDWDIHSRKWRVPVLISGATMQAVGIWLSLSWGFEQLAVLLTGLWLITTVYLVVTLKWRVSIHVGILATIASLAVLLGGWRYAWLFSVVVIVAWARVVGHDHTPAQTMVGGLIPPITLVLTLLILP